MNYVQCNINDMYRFNCYVAIDTVAVQYNKLYTVMYSVGVVVLVRSQDSSWTQQHEQMMKWLHYHQYHEYGSTEDEN